jgi:serine/threonine protein kinase
MFKGASGLSDDARAELLTSFVREGALLAELSEVCSAVCQARDVGSLTAPDGTWLPFMVLEWLDGTALDIVLARERRPRTVKETVKMLSPIATALACAHARGVVHRDVKPGNIILLRQSPERKARCKLIDFGIAKVAREGNATPWKVIERSFTPSYGAPEQFDASYGPTGPWTDVYALALVAVAVICGREPLQGGDVAALRRWSCDPQRRPSPRALGVEVGEDVELVLRRALSVVPGDRFQGMRAFWSALSRAAGQGPATAKQAANVADSPMPLELRRVLPAEVRRPRRNAWRAAVLAATIVSALTTRADSGTPVRPVAREIAPRE